MKQHPLCTDPDHGPTILDLPIPDGLKMEWAGLETRRHFLGKMGKVLGWAAMASLVGDRVLTGNANAANTTVPPPEFLQAASFCPESQTRDLPFHVWRSATDGLAGLQTETRPTVRHGYSRLGARKPATHRNDRGPGAFSDCTLPLGIQAIRQVRGVGKRSAALYGADGGRPYHHSIDQHGRHQSRTGDHAHEHRKHELRKAVSWLLAFLWTWQHER